MITKKQINKIRNLIKKGMKLREIARKLNLNVSTISYHANEETRKKRIQQQVDSFKRKSLEERRIVYKTRLPYLREYQKEKYNTDKDFKEKKQKCSRDYYTKKLKVENLKGGITK